MNKRFPLFLKYNYEDNHFKLKITIDEEIKNYNEKKSVSKIFLFIRI